LQGFCRTVSSVLAEKRQEWKQVKLDSTGKKRGEETERSLWGKWNTTC
jgi:hypothetical protein